MEGHSKERDVEHPTTMANCRDIIRKLTNDLLEKNEKEFNATINDYGTSFDYDVTITEDGQGATSYKRIIDETLSLVSSSEEDEDVEDEQCFDKREKLLDELRCEGDRLLNDGPPSLMRGPVIEAINNIIASSKSVEKTDDDFFEAIHELSHLIKHYDADCHERLQEDRDKLQKLELKELELNKALAEKCNIIDQYHLLIDQYEKLQFELSVKFAEEELLENNALERVYAETELAKEHANAVETATANVNKKLDRCRLILGANVSNERDLLERNEHLKEAVEKNEAHYKNMKEAYQRKLQDMNETYNNLLGTVRDDNQRLTMLLRHADMKVSAAENANEQKRAEKERQEAVCNDLLRKMPGKTSNDK